MFKVAAIDDIAAREDSLSRGQMLDPEVVRNIEARLIEQFQEGIVRDLRRQGRRVPVICS